MLNATARQLGAAVGVSIFIAIQAATGTFDGFRDAWWTFAVVGLAGALPLFVPSQKVAS